MPRLRVGLAQTNCTVGDLAGNLNKLKDYTRRAAAQEVDLLAFPELAICGYPPEDLLLKPAFIADATAVLANLVAFSREFPRLVSVVGCVANIDDGLRNSAAVVHHGSLVGAYHKVNLPNYGVFDEKRYFEPGKNGLVVDLDGVLVGISICEDIWGSSGAPAAEAAAGAGLIINLNASPFHVGKAVERRRMLSKRALEYGAAVAYVNLIGGQDELVFDGQSLVFGPDGTEIAAAKQFKEDLLVIDVDLSKAAESGRPAPSGAQAVERCKIDRRVAAVALPTIKPERIEQLSPDEEILEALTLGVRDYVGKNSFSDVLVGLSGGVDSALTAAVAARALGADRIKAVFLPARYTSTESEEDARSVAANLGIKLQVIEIEKIYAVYLETLKPIFSGLAFDATEENIQARVRGNILMALSNKFGWLLLTTGNKSEMSVGYATLYGDMSGGLAVLKDVGKQKVYALARLINAQAGRAVIPERVLEKPPSAELRQDQKDSDTLPEYAVLDPIIEAYVEENKSAAEIEALGHSPAVVRQVLNLVDRSEYKRRQAPPGIKVTHRAFGKDWRVPITNRYAKRP